MHKEAFFNTDAEKTQSCDSVLYVILRVDIFLEK